MSAAVPESAIAVIGMTGRFPGARDVEELFRNLREGRETIDFLDRDEIDLSEIGEEAFDDPHFVPAVPRLEGIELFDSDFFGLTQREAEIMDPQHRIFLECAWQALEDAGYDPARFGGAIGIFGGAGTNAYVRSNLLSNRALARAVGGFQISIGNDKDYLTTRVSYKLDLKGPSINVQTACSTSLVAVHLAGQSLLAFECDLALAGAISISVPHNAGYFYTPDGIDSPDGHCRAFDARAQGTVFGSGAGLVALRRLEDALEDGDSIRAVIRGSAINNDGSAKVGYTAPGVDGQVAVISEALAAGGVDPASIGYIEAHGTGTPLGDPIEVAALTEVFREHTDRQGFCALGSIKTNLGHLDAAAGITGLIKTVLALDRGEIPPSLHFEQPNPGIDFAASPFFVADRLLPWRKGKAPRRAGVSSFGIGGTNAHVVLEEAPAREPSKASRPFEILLLSARTPAALDSIAARLADHLETHPDLALGDVSFTLAAGRRAFEHRAFAVCRDHAEAVAALSPGTGRRLVTGAAPEGGDGERPVAFLFPGQGSQYPGMGRELYVGEAVFRDAIDACADRLQSELSLDLRALLFPEPRDLEKAAEDLRRTDLTQTALFTVEYALARQWEQWGVTPRAMIGHSIGEVVAATLAGVFELEDALALVAARGRLMASLPGGAMLAVSLGSKALEPLLSRVGGSGKPSGIEIAALNAPDLTVVSGSEEEVAALAELLQSEGTGGVETRRLHTSHAFHSATMEPILDEFRRQVEKIPLRPPAIPFLSNVTGTWIEDTEAIDPGYWARHLRSTVRYSQDLEKLLADPDLVFLEVGPGRTLGQLARRHPVPDQAAGRTLAASLPGPRDGGDSETAFILRSCGLLWIAGTSVDPASLGNGDGRRRRVPLPTYPFERRRCWVDPQPRVGGGSREATSFPSLVPETDTAPVDRPAASTGSRPPVSTPFVEPTTELEAEVIAAWSELLGIESIGIEDDFFELGGHSLLATRLVALIRRRTGADLPMRTLFEAPTPARLAAEIESRKSAPMGPEEAETAGVTEGAAGAGELPRIVPDPERLHELFPLTEVQQAYWIGRDGGLELGGVATHLYMEFESLGLDLDRFTHAWRRLIERHATLRTVILPEGLQKVLPEVPPFEIEILDLRGAAQEERDQVLADLRRRMSHQVRPTDRWPLFEVRASLLDPDNPSDVTGGDLVRIHLSYDFLLGDAWSWQILFADLMRFYRRPDDEPPALELSFRDYVLAEIELREGETHQRALAYWRERLPELPPGPALPLARDPSEINRPRFTRFTGELPADLWGELKRLAGRRGVTPSGVLLAAFADVLALWSASSLFCLNLTLFNRLPLHPQVEEIIGDFTSLVLLEVDAAAADTFEERARRLQRQLWSDLDHRTVSGVQVIRDLARARGGPVAAMPVVFTSTLHLGDRIGDQEGGELPAGEGNEEPGAFGTALPPDQADQAPGRAPDRLVYSISQTPQVWIDHQVGEQDGVLSFNWDAVAKIFPNGLLPEMFATYVRLLERLAGSEESWVESRRDSVRAVLAAAATAPLESANDTAAPLPLGRLHDPFTERAAERPGAPAVIAPGRTLTYGELDRMADDLARRVRRRGARPGELVAVVMEKGWEQVAAVLAVLRAGAAYLPLDAALPEARLASLLERGECRLALTQERFAEKLASIPTRIESGLEVLAISPDEAPDGADGERPDQIDPAPDPTHGPEDLAYVIFTSGSTGEPKGVMIDHRGALNTVADINRRFALTPDDRVLGLSSLSFDLSVWDVFGTLAAGAALVLPEAEAARDPERWTELIEGHGVTVWNSVPALLEMLVESLEARGRRLPAALRLVLLSGDWIPLALPGRVRGLSDRPGEPEVVSLGGATEASIWSILHPIGEIDPSWSSVPYGKAMVNQRFQVLGPRLETKPVWAPGELYISGHGVALGYWRDPQTTAAAFVNHPDTGERLYDTGDRGRFLPDGNIEFLGREDHQVKIRGHRVELGEIETALLAHPAVRAAVAAAVGELRGAKSLVAYYVLETGIDAPSGPPDAEAFKSHLADRLPYYMVPPTLIALDSLPLSQNGKVDRKALPAPEAIPGERGYVAPDGPLEETLAEVYAEVLGVEKVGAHDNFFELGGDSLMATRATYEIRREFEVELPIGRFFEAATVAELAAIVEDAILAEVEELEETEVVKRLEVRESSR